MRRAVATVALALLWAPPAVDGSSGDDPRAEIRALFETTFTERWRSADADGLAAIWLEDGEWMSLIGSRKVYRGRAEIADVWRIGLQGRDSKDALAISAEVEHLRILREGLAQADVLLTFGTEATGTIREAMFATLSKTSSGWKVASARVARLPD